MACRAASSSFIEVDNLTYKFEETCTITGTCYSYLSSSSHRELPRNCVSVHGFVVSVHGFHFDQYYAYPGLRIAVCLPSWIQHLSSEFFGHTSLPAIAFEPGSSITCIPNSTFAEFRLLRSICIPSSVKILGQYCFARCESLSVVTFESGSRLSQIEPLAFETCPSLFSISLPSRVDTLSGSVFAFCRLKAISVADDNGHLKVNGTFLTDLEGVSIIRNFGRGSVLIGRYITRLDHYSFSGCDEISSVMFESGSGLPRIEERAFSRCSLTSICIPWSVTELCLRFHVVQMPCGSHI
jgi:hypothetical protein